ncbi:hydrogenase maturation nickel metallochaperone HypA [Planctomycetota bacterium]
MHETMIAQSLLEHITAEAQKQKAIPVMAKISCGKLNTVNDEVLCFAFESISKGTLCQELKLEIEHKPLLAKCKNCTEIFHLEHSDLKCSKCGSEEFELQPDAPLMLEEIEFNTE